MDKLLWVTIAHKNSASIRVLLVPWTDPTHAIPLSKVDGRLTIGKVLAYLE